MLLVVICCLLVMVGLAALYVHLGWVGIVLFLVSAALTALADGLAMLLPPYRAAPAVRSARPAAGVAIAIAWNLPALALLCAGPLFWQYYALVYAGASVALAGFIAAVPHSAAIRTWMYGTPAPEEPKRHYRMAAFMLFLAAGCVVGAILQGG